MSKKEPDGLVIKGLTSFDNGGDGVRIGADQKITLENPIVYGNDGHGVNVLGRRVSTTADKWYKKPSGIVALSIIGTVISAIIVGLGRLLF